MSVFIICGSESDLWFANKITQSLTSLNIQSEVHFVSAHKNTLQVLSLLGEMQPHDRYVIIILLVGLHALSGVVAVNSKRPVIACPPFKDNVDMLVNINSPLQMPSKVPVLTILDPGNCALAVKRILDMNEKNNLKYKS